MNKNLQEFDRYREQEVLEEDYYERYGEDEDEWRIEDLDD
jgi:hypothetical protein